MGVSKREIHLAPQSVDVGTATNRILKSNALPAHTKIQSQKSCVTMLVSIVQKLQERCPLKHAIVRNASSLSPIKMSVKPEVCTLQFSYFARNTILNSKHLMYAPNVLMKCFQISGGPPRTGQ